MQQSDLHFQKALRTMQQLRVFFYLCLGLLWQACANIVPPTGGERDTTPPKLVKAVPPSGTLFFKERYIFFAFDEYIKLNSPSNVRITPAIEGKMGFEERFNTLKIDLGEDSLRSNTTYTINFADLMGDLNESNRIQNFRYVFSTGDYLDSLELSGKVLDAEKMEAVADVTIALYPEDYGDSAIFKRKPFYFIKTDKEGKFKLENLKSGSYTLLAFGDEDNNLQYKISEKLAFTDSILTLDTTLRVPIEFRLFTDTRANQRLVERRVVEPGAVRLKFSFRPDSLHVKRIDQGSKPVVLWQQGDSAFVYHQDLETDTLLFEISYDGRRDTVKLVNRKLGERGMPKTLLRLKKDNQPSVIEPLKLVASRPLVLVNSAAFIWKVDTLPNQKVPAEIVIKDNELLIKPTLEPNKRYELFIADGALTDWFGGIVDTFRFSFSSQSLEAFSELIVEDTDSLPALYTHLQLLNEQNELLETRKLVAGEKIVFKRMRPVGYRIRLLADENGNERFDNGSFVQRRQPERLLYLPETVRLRANWEISVSLKPLRPAPAAPLSANDSPTKEE
jgi:hypothetical protein